MNKKDIKKNILVLGLGAALTLNTVGCSAKLEKINDRTTSTSVSEEMKTYKTKDYYLVYLDGNFYLTTKEKTNYYRDGELTHNYAYYDVKTGELIGEIIEPRVGRGIKYIDPNHGIYAVDYLHDYDIYNGEYGYGRIIPYFSLIPISNIISSDEFTTLEYDFLSSNSEELHKKVKDYKVFNNIYVIDYYKYYSIFATDAPSNTVQTRNYGSNGKYVPTYKTDSLKKYVCVTKDGNNEILLGYRCSYSNKDLGYEYVYDILTGSIKYVGSTKENSYVNVQEYTYENTDNLSVLINKFNNMSEEIKETNTEIKMNSEDVFILDTTLINSLSEWEYDYLTDNVEQLYFFYNTKEIDSETSWLIFQDLHNDAEVLVEENYLNLNYFNNIKNVIIIYTQEITNNNRPIKPINIYLKAKGREDLIKDEYTLEDIEIIKNTLYSLNNVKKLTK